MLPSLVHIHSLWHSHRHSSSRGTHGHGFAAAPDGPCCTGGCHEQHRRGHPWPASALCSAIPVAAPAAALQGQCVCFSVRRLSTLSALCACVLQNQVRACEIMDFKRLCRRFCKNCISIGMASASSQNAAALQCGEVHLTIGRHAVAATSILQVHPSMKNSSGSTKHHNSQLLWPCQCPHIPQGCVGYMCACVTHAQSRVSRRPYWPRWQQRRVVLLCQAQTNWEQQGVHPWVAIELQQLSRCA